MIGEYVDNYRNGTWIWYYVDGKKMKEELYKTLVGFPVPILKKSTNWFENGNKKRELTFKDGKEVGSEIWWYKNGNKCSIETYKNGKLISSKLWRENGNIVE